MNALEAPSAGGVSVYMGGLQTKADAEAAMLGYYDKWPHLGYGTSLQVKQDSDGDWCVVGHRAGSCD